MDARLKKCSWFIHLFAIAHTISSLVMGNLGLNDEVVLSLLTISMIILVTHIFGLPLEVSAALAALCCFAGFYLGTIGGKWLTATEVPLLISYNSEITTFVVTEILGWATTLIAARRK
ncbi:MAG: hypothetical protein J6V28_05865 [Tidjanibacter sp.]|jgi:uncharacterized protein (DUF697 family)|nr:hypothetical protein [Tidjanibacter sp.]MBQ2248396.1 hypothetical protein [Tidjanibacter sp.]